MEWSGAIGVTPIEFVEFFKNLLNNVMKSGKSVSNTKKGIFSEGYVLKC